jgi:hypothetical protein
MQTDQGRDPMSNLAWKGIAALAVVALAAAGLGTTSTGKPSGDPTPPSSSASWGLACERASTAFTVLTQAPLQAPFRSFCGSAEFERVVATWGADNLTILMDGRASSGSGPNATAQTDEPAIGGPARFTVSWVAACDPSSGNAGACFYSEWWSADLAQGTVAGPFASAGAPWRPPTGTAMIFGAEDGG